MTLPGIHSHRGAIQGLLCILSAWIISSEFATGDELGDVANAIERNHKQFRSIPSLRVKYQLKYEVKQGTRTFAFDELTGIQTRRGKMSLVSIDATVKSLDARVFRSIAWNGRLGTSYFKADHQFSITRREDSLLRYYAYYVNLLGYEDEAGSLPTLSPKNKGRKDESWFWLPSALRTHISAYRISRLPEDPTLVVLEAPGRDRIVVDPSRHHVIISREVSMANSGRLQSRSKFSDFREVAGTWLPFDITVEEFPRLSDESADPAQPAGVKHLVVESMSTDDVPESTFTLDIPSGVSVSDQINRRTYVTSASDDPSPEAVTAVSGLLMAQGRQYWLLIVATLAMLGILLGLAWAARRSRSTQSVS